MPAESGRRSFTTGIHRPVPIRGGTIDRPPTWRELHAEIDRSVRQEHAFGHGPHGGHGGRAAQGAAFSRKTKGLALGRDRIRTMLKPPRVIEDWHGLLWPLRPSHENGTGKIHPQPALGAEINGSGRRLMYGVRCHDDNHETIENALAEFRGDSRQTNDWWPWVMGYGGRSMQTRSGRCGSSWRCLRTSLQDSNFVPMRSRPHSLRSKRSFRRRPHRCSIERRPMRRINLSPRNAEVLGRRRPEEMGWPAPGTARIAPFSEDSYTRLRGRAPGDGDSRGGGSGRDRHSRRRRVEAASANRPRRRSGAESPRQRGRRAAGRAGPAGGARRRSRSRRRPAPYRRAQRLPPRPGAVVGGDRRLPLRRTGTAEVRPRPKTRQYTRFRHRRPG